MTIEDENESEECTANKRNKEVPVEVHKVGNGNYSAIPESSGESVKS